MGLALNLVSIFKQPTAHSNSFFWLKQKHKQLNTWPSYTTVAEQGGGTKNEEQTIQPFKHKPKQNKPQKPGKTNPYN